MCYSYHWEVWGEGVKQCGNGTIYYVDNSGFVQKPLNGPTPEVSIGPIVLWIGKH